MNRRERRANPDQWWKLIGYQDVGGITRELPEEYAQYVKGEVGSVVAITVPASMSPAEREGMKRAIHATFAMGEADHHIVVVPDNIAFVRMRPIVGPVADELDRALRRSQFQTKMQMKAAEETERKKS